MALLKKNKFIYLFSVIILTSFLSLSSNTSLGYALNNAKNDLITEISNSEDFVKILDYLIIEIINNKNNSNIDEEDFLKIKDIALNLSENINVNKDSIMQAKLNYIIGSSYYYLFDYEKAYNHLNISSQNFSDKIDYNMQIDTYYLLSKINLNNGKHDESENCFIKSIELGLSKEDYVLVSNLYIIRAKDLSRNKNNSEKMKINIDNAIKTVDNNNTFNKGEIYHTAGLLYCNYLDKILLGNDLLLKAKTIFEEDNNILSEINCRINLSKNNLIFNNSQSTINLLSPLISDEIYKSQLTELSYIIINLYLFNAYTSISDYDNANMYLSNLEKTLSKYDGVEKFDALILKHIYKSKYYTKLGDEVEAFKEINDAFELYNTNMSSISVSDLNMQLECAMGDIYFEFNNINKAIEHHTKALELSKNNIDSLNTMKYTEKLAIDNDMLNNHKKSSMLFKEFNELLKVFVSNNMPQFIHNTEYNIETTPNNLNLNTNSNINTSIKKEEQNNIKLTEIIFIPSTFLLVVYSLLLNYRLSKIKNNSNKLSSFYDIDKITGLYTTKYLNDYLYEKWNLSDINKTNISMIAINININDNTNYKNSLLSQIISNLKNNCLRENDIIVCNNEDSSTKKVSINSYEFLIPLLGVDKSTSIKIAERINNVVSNISTSDERFNNIKINTYIGISTLIPMNNSKYSSLINRTYAALYYSITNEVTYINHIDDIVDMI